MLVRKATFKDLDEIRMLYYDTIRVVNSKDYNPEQIGVWSSGYENLSKWNERIKDQIFFIAELDSKIVGIISLIKDGYLDIMFVHKDYQRQGVATYLFSEINQLAVGLSLKEITADVSITARPFFEKRGFAVIKEQIVEVKGIKLKNYKMLRSYQ